MLWIGNAGTVQFIAQRYGDDEPGNPLQDPRDIAANQTGIDLARMHGPTVSCFSVCKDHFVQETEKHCCKDKPYLTKSDPTCCKPAVAK